MKYSILVQDSKDPKLYKFLTVKEEVMKEIHTEEVDGDIQEVRDVITYEPTGEMQTVLYYTDDKQAFEEKYIAMLDSYNRKQVIPISIEDYDLDMIFKSDFKEG